MVFLTDTVRAACVTCHVFVYTPETTSTIDPASNGLNACRLIRFVHHHVLFFHLLPLMPLSGSMPRRKKLALALMLVAVFSDLLNQYWVMADRAIGKAPSVAPIAVWNGYRADPDCVSWLLHLRSPVRCIQRSELMRYPDQHRFRPSHLKPRLSASRY